MGRKRCRASAPGVRAVGRAGHGCGVCRCGPAMRGRASPVQRRGATLGLHLPVAGEPAAPGRRVRQPGLLWVEQGRELWRHADGASGASCATCHGEAVESMRGVRTRYPHFDPQRGKLINLEQQINRCREAHMQAPAYPYESAALLALTTFVSFQSRGLPMDVRSDGPAAPFFEAGKVFFHQRRGQLDLACAHCHDQQAGQRLRGEVISQGQTNGFPSTATSGRLWPRRIACSPGATPPCEPSPTRTAPTNTSTLSCSWPGGAWLTRRNPGDSALSPLAL